MATFFTLFYAMAILFIFVWRSTALEKTIGPDEYLFATFMIFTSGFALLALLVKDFFYSKFCTTGTVTTTIPKLHEIKF
jgi:hypothetical protein